MKYVLIFLCIILTGVCNAQTLASAGQYQFSKDISFQSRSEAYQSPFPANAQRSKSCLNAATVTAYVLAFSGGAMVGYTLGTALGGGDPNWVVAGVGAGLIGIAIPLSIIGEKRCNSVALLPAQGDDLYARQHKKSELFVVANATQVGLRLQF